MPRLFLWSLWPLLLTVSAAVLTTPANESGLIASTAAPAEPAARTAPTDGTTEGKSSSMADSATYSMDESMSHTPVPSTEPVPVSLTTGSELDSTESPSSQPGTGHCSLALLSNLFRCSDETTWWQSKADLNELKMQLAMGQSETICCRDWQNRAIYSTLAQHRDSQVGARMQIDCSPALADRRSADGNALTTIVTGSELHCYNLCNTTLILGDGGRTHYNLILPVHFAPDECRWRLIGVSEIVISKSQRQVWHKFSPFLCLSNASHPRDCDSESRFAQRYPSSSRSSDAALQCHSGDCYLWYNLTAAIASLRQFNFRSFKVELIHWPKLSFTSEKPPTSHDMQQPATSVLTPAPPKQKKRPPTWAPSATTAVRSQLTPSDIRRIPPPPPPSRSSETFPLEFRVTRGVMAGVTAAAVALICAAVCIWACRSWHYRMYSSPLRRLLGRTPLHRLPTYSSRLFDLDRLQLDRPCSAKEARVPSLSSSSSDDPDEEDVEEEEIEMMMELEADRSGLVGTATWRRI